jgi:hypothetical protein
MCGGNSTVGSNPTGTAIENPRSSGGFLLFQRPVVTTRCMHRTACPVRLVWQCPRSQMSRPEIQFAGNAGTRHLRDGIKGSELLIVAG